MSSGEVQSWADDRTDVELQLKNKSVESIETNLTTDEKHHEIVEKDNR